MATRVLVVGCGPAGLMALKNLREDGFDVTAYEKRDYVGGLWKQSNDSSLSIASTTRFNSSIHRSAISDFPFPEGVDDYPTGEQFHRYLQTYCDHFGLNGHIKLSTEVTAIDRGRGQWHVTSKMEGSDPQTDCFDKVLVAIGSFNTPRSPKFEGIERFQGRTLHAIDFHLPSQFKDQNVLVIGLHASAQDTTKLLSDYAARVYISHTSGVLLLPRYTPSGTANDAAGSLKSTFSQMTLQRWFPTFRAWYNGRLLTKLSKQAFPDVREEWNFLPIPSLAVSPPLVADELYPLLKSGFATPVAPVLRVTGSRTIELKNGQVLDDIDTIIYCTGYTFDAAFVPSEHNPFRHVVGQSPKLYQNIFPLSPDPDIRNSLAFLGQSFIWFPGLIQMEAAGMAISQVWRGKSTLPRYEGMQEWFRKHLTWREQTAKLHNAQTTFYPPYVSMPEYLKWLDATAGIGLFDSFGWFSWRAWEFWWHDANFYNKCLNGLFTPTLWRLFDMGKRKPMDWETARAQIFEDNSRVERNARKRREAANPQAIDNSGRDSETR